MNPRHQLTQHRHCSRFIVQRFLFTLLVTSSFPSLSPLYRSSPQDAPHRWNHRPSPRNLHPHQMDLDRPLYFTASQTTDAAGRRGDSRPSKYHHGVSFHCFCLEEDTQKKSAPCLSPTLFRSGQQPSARPSGHRLSAGYVPLLLFSPSPASSLFPA
jgi:hypothetical protein